MPTTAASSLFTFYDIESLSNAFTLCTFTPRNGELPAVVEMFYLVDDPAVLAGFCPEDLEAAVHEGNPGLPAVSFQHHDLRTPEANLRLAHLMGLSDAENVNDPLSPSSLPSDLRPVCDTDSNYHPSVHPFLAGYNSQHYDTTMLALYLAEVFSGLIAHQKQLTSLREELSNARSAGDHEQVSHAQQELDALKRTGPAFTLPTTEKMRMYSNALFTDEFRAYMPRYLTWGSTAQRIRQSMINSGRHLDVARLNELQWKVSLKRLLGMLGHQIKESEKLSHDSTLTDVDELYELLAYNVADCFGLAQLFAHPTYSNAFDLKAGLLEQYPQTVRMPDGTIKHKRLTIDSSSAKFVSQILAPFGSLSDIEAVSFDYPHPEIARERGIEPSNVLDDCVRFFEDNVVPERDRDPAQAEIYAQFQQVVAYYKSIENKNFNDSDKYQADFPNGRPAMSLREIAKLPNNLPYFTRQARPSSCFATFSTGGIHGAEANIAVFDRDMRLFREQSEMLMLAKQLFPDATQFVEIATDQHNELRLPDGSTVDKRKVLIGSDPAKVRYRKPKASDPDQCEQLTRAQNQVPDPAELLATMRPAEQRYDVVIDDQFSPTGTTRLEGKAILAKTSAQGAQYREQPAAKQPELFVTKDDGSTKLHPSYVYTSAGDVIHEDFTSYYPNLLRNMRAFYNPELGEDRYAAIFFDKERYGREMKTPGICAEERTRLNILRNGTKLILNSASGAGDASHDNPIRMNNRIISMRIIGQLFSWRIGQAQALAGARIISTNTDGLYSVLDEETNNRVLAEQSQQIGVDIEPEPMVLISKDSNNRLELTRPEPGQQLTDSKIISASGGTLACHDGPTPTKSLAHPAVIDYALARYLTAVAAEGESKLSEDFDPALGEKIIRSAIDDNDLMMTALLFQNIVTASRGSITYPFAADPISSQTAEQDDPKQLCNPRPLQMVNRVFIVKDGTPGAVSLHNAGAWKVPPASQLKRKSDGLPRVTRSDTIARMVLKAHGWAAVRSEAAQNSSLTLVPEDQDVVVRRINGIDPAWSMLIDNGDLHAHSDEQLRELIASLDIETYTQILGETFTKNWKNPSLAA